MEEETVALVHTGASPLRGLTDAPLIFQNGESDQAVWLADQSMTARNHAHCSLTWTIKSG